MPYKSQKKYRYKKYDYSRNGYYFLTICTKNREMFLGNIAAEKMQLSPIGKKLCRYANIELKNTIV